MDDKITSTTENDVRGSVSALYASILAKRKEERLARQTIEEQEKAARKEMKAAEKEREKGEKLTKKQKREAEFRAWKEIVVGLTGDDLEYSDSPKKKKKKYRKWIGDDVGPDTMKPKEKKGKKKNYRKEFAPELNMLRTLVADQNRFTTEVMRRFQNAAGPATKDAMPLNKTLVDMAAVINTSRKNSLDYLNAIANVKKTIADLYLKQLKADGGASTDSQDLALVGSSLGNLLLGDGANNNPLLGPQMTGAGPGPIITQPGVEAVMQTSPVAQAVQQMVIQGVSTIDEEFDPSSWTGAGLNVNDEIKFENVPHTLVMEWNKSTNTRRMKAVGSDGKEIPGFPVPDMDLSRLKVNETEMIVKGEFAESYPVEII